MHEGEGSPGNTESMCHLRALSLGLSLDMYFCLSAFLDLSRCEVLCVCLSGQIFGDFDILTKCS